MTIDNISGSIRRMERAVNKGDMTTLSCTRGKSRLTSLGSAAESSVQAQRTPQRRGTHTRPSAPFHERAPVFSVFQRSLPHQMNAYRKPELWTNLYVLLILHCSPPHQSHPVILGETAPVVMIGADFHRVFSEGLFGLTRSPMKW